MLQLGREADLALEPLGADGSRKFRQHHLDRHLAFVPDVCREVDRGHAATTEFTFHRVATAECLLQAQLRVRRCRLRRHRVRRYSVRR